MATVPFQTQTTGIHSALSEPELSVARPVFHPMALRRQSLFTHSIQVFWGVQLCRWVRRSRRIEGSHCSHLQGQAKQRGIRRKLFSQRHGVATPL